MTKTKWIKCPLCGEPDMRAEYEEGPEKRLAPIITCVNHGCVSNTGYPEDNRVNEKSLNYLEGFYKGNVIGRREKDLYIKSLENHISLLERQLQDVRKVEK